MHAVITSSKLQTLKANGSSMHKSRGTMIQLTTRHKNAISGIMLTFFISSPPFRYYYSILWDRLQEEMKHSLREYEAEALRLL